MSAAENERDQKKQMLKALLQKLHEGASPVDLKNDLKQVLGDIQPSDIAQIEQELIESGVPREEIRKICDVHLALMRESLETEGIATPTWHPIHTLMQEHDLQLRFAERLRNASKELERAGGLTSAGDIVDSVVENAALLTQSESHYVREENVLFPYLEKHGITEPPAVMWMDLDAIRKIKKDLRALVDSRGTLPFNEFASSLGETAIALSEMLSGHFFKENRILFPTALRVIAPEEWPHVRKQCDELGYCSFTPEPPEMPVEGVGPVVPTPGEGVLSFESGSMSKEEIEALLNTLPVDITFVGKDDTVRYFSMGKERIFPRTPAIIGRKVQQCHPQNSVHVVNQILDDFRAGRRDSAEFWLNLEGKLVYIRYFPVHDRNGDYLGCLEVSQDIAPLKKIEGEKKLLD